MVGSDSALDILFPDYNDKLKKLTNILIINL